MYPDCTSICCLSLAELSAPYVNSALEQYAVMHPQRLYIGSSFCPQLLLALAPNDIEALSARCSEMNLPMTLVLPISNEGQLDAVNARVEELFAAASGTIDEITVNDFGAFMRWGAFAENTPHCKLNVGRLFNKDLRDPRDPDYDKLPHAPALIERDWRGYSALDRLTATYPVNCVEFDPTHDVLDLSGLPAGVQAAVYGPLCYMSTGQICEFASIGRKAEEKFRPNARCGLQCLQTSIAYNGASGKEFLKLGRSIFFEAQAPVVTGVSSCRNVFAPLKEVLG